MATMDEANAYQTSTEQVQMSNLRARHVPDVPEDIDFFMEHLNDPNYDLKARPPSFRSVDEKKSTKKAYAGSEVDAESQYDSDRYSTSRAESRNSTAIDFDE